MPRQKPAAPNIIPTTRASQHEIGAPSFMWFPWLPYRKLVVVQGESGIGKSTFMLHIASLLSRGKPMPFAQEDAATECGDILYLNKEDDVAETINPRLRAMNADFDRFHIADSSFVFDGGCERLANTIRALNIKLVIIDPLTSFLGKGYNMNTAQSVGNLMRDLSRTAFDTGAVIAVICHLTKNAGGKEIDRHLGSSDIMNAARSVLSATRIDEDSDVVVVKHLKSTLAKRAKPFNYEAVDNGVIEIYSGEGTVDLQCITPLLTKREIALRTLEELLSSGAKPQPEIKALFDGMGVGWRTVETAKSELGVVQSWQGDTSWWEFDA